MRHGDLALFRFLEGEEAARGSVELDHEAFRDAMPSDIEEPRVLACTRYLDGNRRAGAAIGALEKRGHVDNGNSAHRHRLSCPDHSMAAGIGSGGNPLPVLAFCSRRSVSL